MKQRCKWVGKTKNELNYHDKEWGVPVHNDTLLFEFLILEGAQAGLSWSTVLNKRKEYIKAFDGFNTVKIARYDNNKILELLNNPGIVRNRLKVESSVKNARAFIKVKNEYGSFDSYIWRFMGGHPKVNHWKNMKQIPAQTDESEALSRDLKKRGFSFVGPTICYAFMQAVGLVNDHTTDCFRWHEICARNRRLVRNPDYHSR